MRLHSQVLRLRKQRGDKGKLDGLKTGEVIHVRLKQLFAAPGKPLPKDSFKSWTALNDPNLRGAKATVIENAAEGMHFEITLFPEFRFKVPWTVARNIIQRTPFRDVSLLLEQEIVGHQLKIDDLHCAFFRSPYNFTVTQCDADINDRAPAAGHTHGTRLSNAEVALPLLKKDLKKVSKKLDTPISQNFLEHWKMLRAVDIDAVGHYQLRTVVSPVPFLRKVVSDIFTDVFQLLDRLSRRNNPGDTFDEEAYHTVLRLSLLIAPLFFQCTVSQSSLKKRIKYYMERRWDALFDDFMECLKTPVADSSSGSWAYPEETDDFHFDNIMEKLGKKAERNIRNGEMRKALVSLCDPPTYAANSAEVFADLQAKHPVRLPENDIDVDIPGNGEEDKPPEDEVIVITEDMLIQVIRDSPKESAPRDGWVSDGSPLSVARQRPSRMD
jgi:hypothetical protein